MILGIDLGTTNSLAAIFRDGTTHLVPNALGHYLTPSAVSFVDDGTTLVGLAARERLSTHPQATAVAFKRWMGSDQRITLGRNTLRAEELSALVLKSLKADAEAFLGEPVTEAVITVPAYFNNQQRQATKTAGELAGLKVERLLNEPTAAGLAYGLQSAGDHTTFLVFDLGGGTFDVSVLEYFEGVVEVRASAGDTRLGGEDFVQVLIDWFLEKNPALAPHDKDHDLLRNDKALWRMAEQAKRELSEADAAVLSLSHNGSTATLEVTRHGYEERCAPLLQRLRKPIERALQDARLDPGALTEVVMVGGASRMPMVRHMVTRLFGRLPLRTINPDETIARGAAIQAALKSRDCALAEVVLTDVMPFSLGIVISETVGKQSYSDRFSPIIERNTSVPISREYTYQTMADEQKVLELDVRQGESAIGSENLQLGTLAVPVPPRPAGEVKVKVRFTYDANGLLEVDAHVPLTGHTSQKLIQQGHGQMDAQQIARARDKLQALKVHPRDKQENAYLLARTRRLYEDRLGEERQAVGRALTQFEAILDSQDEHEIRQIRTSLKAFLDSIDKSFVL